MALPENMSEDDFADFLNNLVNGTLSHIVKKVKETITNPSDKLMCILTVLVSLASSTIHTIDRTNGNKNAVEGFIKSLESALVNLQEKDKRELND